MNDLQTLRLSVLALVAGLFLTIGTAPVMAAESSRVEQTIEEVYQGKMRRWHDGRFHFDGCAGCRT